METDCAFSLFDWKMETVHNKELDTVNPGVENYLTSATLSISDQGIDSYPRVAFAKNHVLSNWVHTATIKSLYRYRWRTTSYLVEMTVNRRWPELPAMLDEAPTTDFEVSMYDENWNQDLLSEGAPLAETARGERQNGLSTITDSESRKVMNQVLELVRTTREVGKVLSRATYE
jgi:hypothetical protein